MCIHCLGHFSTLPETEEVGEGWGRGAGWRNDPNNVCTCELNGQQQQQKIQGMDTGGVVQVGEGLTGKYEALSSSPSTAEKKLNLKNTRYILFYY
jgi:hypothetical protein